MGANVLNTSSIVVGTIVLIGVWFSAQGHQPGMINGKVSAPAQGTIEQERSLVIQYLEIVTPKVDQTCAALGEAHGVVFGEPVAMLGNARTANLADGGRLGVRAPMREDEDPVVRPYVLVQDIDAAVESAKQAGAELAVPPMEIPGQGTFSIYVLGGIEHGLWKK